MIKTNTFLAIALRFAASALCCTTFGNELSLNESSVLLIDYENVSRLAAEGDPDAQNRLGDMYLQGEIVEQDYNKAYKWYNKAVGGGNMNARNAIAQMYHYGWGVEQSPDAAVLWYLHPAENGCVKSQSALGFIYYYNFQNYTESAKWYRLAADQGDADSQAEMGLYYLYGLGVSKDEAEAIRYLTAAAKQENQGAISHLASLYQNGEVVAQDFAEASQFHMILAEKGDTQSMKALGDIYHIGGFGVARDYVMALKWYTMASDNGCKIAPKIIGDMYRAGHGVEQSYSDAITWYTLSANRGNDEAQLTLGDIYHEAIGIEQNDEAAVKWYLAAAEKGNPEAQYKVATMFDNGEGVVEDKYAAFLWYLEAAAKGHFEAQEKLDNSRGRKVNPHFEKWLHKPLDEKTAENGTFIDQMIFANMYFEKQEYTNAIRWYRLVAERDYAIPMVTESQLKLAKMFYEGKGVAQDHSEAIKWFYKAAEQSNAVAAFNLGLIYSDDNYSGKNYRESVEWYRKAAQQGAVSAIYNLGYMYRHGKGVMQDDVESCAYYLLAGMQGEDASKMISILRDELDPWQYEAAKERAKELNKHYALGSTTIDQPNEKNPIDGPSAFGTGFFVSDDGHFLTAAHVVAGSSKLEVYWDNQTLSAELISLDLVNDIALLKVSDAKPKPLVIKQHPMKSGAKVFTVGFPNLHLQGASPKYTDGTISSVRGVMDDIRQYQISIPVQPGNSGGPLCDDEGSVVGIITSKLALQSALDKTGSIPENVNYAVKIAYAMPVMADIPGIIDVSRRPEEYLMSDRVEGSVVQAVELSTGLLVVYD